MGIIEKVFENDAILLFCAKLSDQYFSSYSQNKIWRPVHFHLKSQYTSSFLLIARKLLKLQFPANHLLMGFWNALSDGEVKFDLNVILVAQNAEKMGFYLLKIEISKIRSRHLKRLEKLVGTGLSPLAAILKPLDDI